MVNVPKHPHDALRAFLTWAADDSFVVLDTETTGVGAEDHIIEIAVVTVHGEVLLDTLVRPPIQVPASAYAVHGISNADVRRAPTFLALWPRLRALLRGRRVIAFNSSFDARMLRRALDDEFGSRDYWPETNHWRCAMQAYAALSGQPRIKLVDACAREGISYTPHRALADTLATAQLIRAVAHRARDLMSFTQRQLQLRARDAATYLQQRHGGTLTSDGHVEGIPAPLHVVRRDLAMLYAAALRRGFYLAFELESQPGGQAAHLTALPLVHGEPGLHERGPLGVAPDGSVYFAVPGEDGLPRTCACLTTARSSAQVRVLRQAVHLKLPLTEHPSRALPTALLTLPV